MLRANRFGLREATEADGTAYLYGDRHQCVKLATLLTHTGLVLFLVAAAVTSRLGFESGILLASGESQPVRRSATPGLIVVKNLGFDGAAAPDGSFADFTTDLAVYRDGQELARKVVRVNDPLSVAGFTFHQNGFGPAPGHRHPGRPGSGAVGRRGRADRTRPRASRTRRWASRAATSASR